MPPKETSGAENRADQSYDVEATLRLTGVSSTCLVRYERASIAVPLRLGRRRWYQPDDLWRIRKARRLERDLGINLAGVEVVLRVSLPERGAHILTPNFLLCSRDIRLQPAHTGEDCTAQNGPLLITKEYRDLGTGYQLPDV
jgi:DNA-binding transcriptional MerR regulator